MKFINVRGCNGSGKTTLLRSIVKASALSKLEEVNCPVAHLDVPPPGKLLSSADIAWEGEKQQVTITAEGLALLGNYTLSGAGSTTAGCDRIKTQDGAKSALLVASRLPGTKVTLFEGVVISTIFDPWRVWAAEQGGMAWAFLDTPLDVCIRRIQERNGGKPIKEDQVADKHRTILRVRQKALDAGLAVYDIHWETALTDLRSAIYDCMPAEDF